VISRVRESFKIELPLRAVFETQTIAGLAARVNQALGGEPEISSAPIEKLARAGKLPLSFAQQRLWFLDQLSPGGSAYNIPRIVRITGRINEQALERTLGEICRRHESLRTNFVMVDGEATQVIHPAGDFALEQLDFSGLDEASREAAAKASIRERVGRPFDLAKDKLLRCSLLKISDAERVLMILMHHIISDGWSMEVFLRELATLYAAYCEDRQSPFDELPIQYADFARWQREWLSGERLDRQMTYWSQRLAGAPATLNLPMDRPRPVVQASESEIRKFTLPAELRERLVALSRDEGATLYMTLLAGYKALLYRYSGQEDVVVGTPIANRNRREIENLIGFFVNMLVLRTDLGGAPSFRELIRRVKETALGAYAHQDLPFEKLVEELQPERDLSYTPFFQATFVLQNASQAKLSLPGMRVEVPDHEGSQAKFDLTLTMFDTEQGLAGTLEYNRHLFDAATIDRLIWHFVNLSEGAVADPDGRIGDLLLLTPAEERMMLVEWNDTRAPFPEELCLHQLFEQCAARRPEAIAVVLGDRQMSYGELNARANQLAHYIMAQGVGPEVVVGLCVERSPEMLVGLLGIMKAGGAYLPLDSTYPPERLSYMLEDAAVKHLVTQQNLLAGLPGSQGRAICLDTEWGDISRSSAENPASVVTPENLAYVIYTSGSTGRPKGTMLRHRGLSNMSEAQVAAYGVEPHDRVSQFSSLSFDASIFDIAMALRSGAALHLIPRDATLSAPTLAALLREQAVTNVALPPSVLSLLPEEALPALRTIIVGGEACPADLAHRWAPGRRFFNSYGPTETTVCASGAECVADGRNPTIGKPIINVKIHLLDAGLQPVPMGAPGELSIGGEGITRGYLGRPDLTAEKLTPDPFGAEPGGRLYRTGDLARYLPGGDIDFLGRIDHQVKLRGFRIELGEIEAG
ncbi:MAG TPA: amino acid adenylation domain-containing protein, partial [Blastocatellia bacterium]|nr:amino acid adenylation domain-containing protein [Blastocatellia bacterium]